MITIAVMHNALKQSCRNAFLIINPHELSKLNQLRILLALRVIERINIIGVTGMYHGFYIS